FLYRNKTQDKKSLQYLIKNLLNEKNMIFWFASASLTQ
ncbi:AraC family transcriptional regulator, partial [Escherichia coli]